MNAANLTFLLAAILVLALTAFWIIKKRQRIAKRKNLAAKPFPMDWQKIIETNVPLYKHLPDSLREQLHGLINIFLAEKSFEGCGGLKLTDEIKVTIAAQASMLLLNRPTGYFRKLRTILVYPHTYAAKAASNGPSVRLGESWQNGPVVLAWDSVTGGARNIKDGKNVVFHEFSHQLDQEDGTADGAPILENRSSYITWARVLGKEYEALRRKRRGKSVMNRYGATNPAEFFAVATESFFEKPKQMNKKHPDLYDELKNYYKLDPLEWS